MEFGQRAAEAVGERAHLMLLGTSKKRNTFQRVSSSMERPRQRPRLKITCIHTYMTIHKSHLAKVVGNVSVYQQHLLRYIHTYACTYISLFVSQCNDTTLFSRPNSQVNAPRVTWPAMKSTCNWISNWSCTHTQARVLVRGYRGRHCAKCVCI